MRPSLFTGTSGREPALGTRALLLLQTLPLLRHSPYYWMRSLTQRDLYISVQNLEKHWLSPHVGAVRRYLIMRRLSLNLFFCVQLQAQNNS